MRSTLFPAQTQTTAPYQPLLRKLTLPQPKAGHPDFLLPGNIPLLVPIISGILFRWPRLTEQPRWPCAAACLFVIYPPPSLCHLQIYPLPAVIFIFTSRSLRETLNNLRPHVSPRGVLLETLLFSYDFPLITMLMSLFSICLIFSPLKMYFPSNSFSKDVLWMPCRGLSILSSCSCFYQLNF